MSCCVIYGTWFRFANSLKKETEDVCLSFLPFAFEFGRFGYHPAITAIQLYNRIKTLSMLSLPPVVHFVGRVIALSLSFPSWTLKQPFITDALPHPCRLCPSASIFVKSFAWACVCLMPDQSWGLLVAAVGSFGTDYKLCAWITEAETMRTNEIGGSSDRDKADKWIDHNKIQQKLNERPFAF